MTPTIGLYAANMGALAEPAAAARIARLPEDLGYDSLWVADHVVLPKPRVEPSPMGPGDLLLDPLIALSFLAARTERIALATGVVVLPQRNPLVLAKQLASIDVLSGGRLVFGFAVGYLEAELRALGTPLDRRGDRAEEYLRAVQSLWYDVDPALHGEFVDLPEWMPIRAPHGAFQWSSAATVARRPCAALSLSPTAGSATCWDCVPRLTTLAELAEHSPRREPLEISVTPSRRLTAEIVGEYGELGVHRLVVAPLPGSSVDEVVEFVEANTPARLGAIAAP